MGIADRKHVVGAMAGFLAGQCLRLAVDESHPRDHLGEPLGSLDLAPGLLSLESELEHHRHSGFLRERPLDRYGAMAQSGQGGLDGICSKEMGPMGGWKVIEGQQGVGIFGETADRLWVFILPMCQDS